jgi:phosphoribosyl-ATP pyrophosphohydrolase/phosphoribosyl-AMP cyclohydrolase
VSVPPEGVRYGRDGLIAGIVQDRADGRVLMVGYLDEEALEATLATGEVHFHSRSRGRLWRKGETSGNVLRLRELSVDCDGDALLLRVDAAGPTCHRGTRSCFDPEGDGDAGRSSGPRPSDVVPSRSAEGQGFAWLEELWDVIDDRAHERPDGSYTARLLAAGVDGPGRKVGEEAVEVLLAAKDDEAAERSTGDRDPTRGALAGEVADLLYHTLVLLAERGLTPRAVLDVLRERAR